MIAATVVAVTMGLEAADFPTAVLFASLLVGIAYALLTREELAIARPVVVGPQAALGVLVGTYVQRSTLGSVASHWLIVIVMCLATLAISVACGLILSRLAPVDQATASFGMIAGGAAGIISISLDLGADDRIVGVLQYLRVLIIVGGAPIVASTVFGAKPALPHTAAAGADDMLGGLGYLALCIAAGLPAARLVRLPAGALLGPMLVAAALTVSGSGVVAAIPHTVTDLAFAAIGLQVGLRFTRASIRQARAVLPIATALIVVMIAASAGVGALLTSLTHVSRLDGYLATTPGGLSAVFALAIGTGTDATFVVSVQVIRTFVMLLAAPPLARWISHRADAEAVAKLHAAHLD